MVSLLMVLEEDDPVETMTVGREGVIGSAVSLGVVESLHRSICQISGESFRLPTSSFLKALGQDTVLSRLVRLYIAFALRSTSQLVACNTLHPVESRASRWLLVMQDQAGRDQFPLTQEFLAFMLGVRRQTVTVVAGALQNAGLIDYRRGTMTIRDRARLEETSCECYGTIRDYYNRAWSIDKPGDTGVSPNFVPKKRETHKT